MPFGLKTAAQTFQRVMDQLFRELDDVYVYIDDILIASKDIESHLSTVDKVLQILFDNDMEINIEKSKFARENLNFLGYEISSKGIVPNQNKIDTIKKFPKPKNKTELRRFLGMINFYRRNIPHLAEILAPLHDMTNDDMNWNENRNNAFEDAKRSLESVTVIAYPSSNLPFQLKTDASELAIGAVLEQIKDGILLVSFRENSQLPRRTTQHLTKSLPLFMMLCNIF